MDQGERFKVSQYFLKMIFDYIFFTSFSAPAKAGGFAWIQLTLKGLVSQLPMQTEVSHQGWLHKMMVLFKQSQTCKSDVVNYKQKMIQYPKTFFTDDIYDQSNNFYVAHLGEMLELTHSVDQQKLLGLLEELSLHHSQMNEIKPLHNYLLHNDRKQLKLLANLLFNKFLTQFLSSTHMAVFIIFTHIVHLRIQNTREIVDKLTQIIYPKVLDCCIIYLQLLKWLREVFQSHKMAGFIQQIARDLHKVEEPLQSLYQSELGLNICFYERESGKNLGLNLKLSKRAKQKMNMQQYLKDQFRSHKLKHNIQKMFQLKQKIFKVLNNFQDIKAHYCLAIGQSLSFVGRFYEAIDQFNQACSYNQELPRIYYQLAKCYFFTQQWGKVCSTVQKFQNEQRIENYFKSWGLAMKGRAIFQTTKLDDLYQTFDQQITRAGLQKAYEYCSEAIKYDQRNFVANETLALVYIQSKNIQEAINILEYSRTEFPIKEQTQLSILLSYCYYLSEIQESPISDMPLQYFFHGFEYKFIGKIIQYYRPELQSMFQQNLLYYKEAHASHFIKMGTVARKQQKIDCAIKYYTRALQKSGRNFIAKLQMAECLKLSKKYFMALKYFKEVYEEHQNIDSDKKIAILRNILSLYAKIFNKNKQLTYFQMKQSLQDAHKFVKELENVTLKMFKITESQQFALQKINSILQKEGKTELYLNHVKIYLNHDLINFANDMLSQLKRDIYDQIQDISPTKVEVQLILHISRIRNELQHFQEAQKQLIRFWKISINNQEEQFLEYFEESYRLLCSILSGKVRQNKRLDFDHLRPYIKIDKINDEKTLESIGNLLVEYNQLREAVKYLHKAQKLSKDNSKSILQKLIQIYSVLVVKSKQASLIQLYDQILPELLSDYEQKITNPNQYKILISASKCLEDFGRIERYYQKLYSQSKTTPSFVQISKDLAVFYYQNQRYEQALQAYSRLFIQEPSRPAIQRMQWLIQKQSDKVLTQKQYLKIMNGLLSQLTDFYKLLINCRYNSYNTCLSLINKWLPQLKKLPPTSLKLEIESKNGLIKKLSSQYSLCSLLIQSILYYLLSTAFPSNKTIQQLININLFPRIYKMLGGRKYFGKEQVKSLLVMIDQKLEQENMRLIFDIVLYRNNKMKRMEENQQILQYVKENHGSLILEKTFLF